MDLIDSVPCNFCVDNIEFNRYTDKFGIWKTLKYKVVYKSSPNIKSTFFIGFGKILKQNKLNNTIEIHIDISNTTTVNLFNKLNHYFDTNFGNIIYFNIDDSLLTIIPINDSYVKFTFQLILSTDNENYNYIPIINYIVSDNLYISLSFFNIYKLLKKKRMIEYRFHPINYLDTFLKTVDNL